MENEDEYERELRSCFGTKECACKSMICKQCRDRDECRKHYKDRITHFKPEMEIK